MTIHDKIWNEKLQNIRSKISALSTRKIDKYEYLAGEEILFSNER